MAAFRDLEILVANIQRYLAPNATVQHNVSLDGRKSGTKRQVDVLVEQMVGQYRMRIVIDSKDYSDPVDLKGVEEFAGLVDDVGGHKGVLVSPSGFTKAAKTRAAGLQIELYSPVDTDPHKWQVKPTAPFLLDYRFAAYSFTLSTSHAGPFALGEDFPTSGHIFDGEGSDLGLPIEIASEHWLDGEKYPIEPGDYRDLELFPGPVFMDDGYGGRAEITLRLNLRVEQELYFGQLPISKVMGFRDEATGQIITRGFTTGFVDPIEMRKTWLRINDRSDAPYPPMMSTVVLGGGGIE
jgi:hypothetical protein